MAPYFFFLQINVYPVSASKYKQIFPLRLWLQQKHMPHSLTFIAVRSTCLKRR